MAGSYASFCDDFYVNMRLGTQLKLATDRASVVSFYERMQRLYPTMVNFRQDARLGETSIDEQHQDNRYRWLSLEPQRLSSGYLNPDTLQEAYLYNSSVLETVPYYLAISTVDLDYLDVLWGFDFEYPGNHHELIADALLRDSPMGRLMDVSESKAINFELSGTVSISEDARTHVKVWIEPRTTAAQIRSGEFGDDMISLYVIIRQWSGGKRLPEFLELHHQLIDQGEKFIEDRLLEAFISPIRETIARRR